MQGHSIYMTRCTGCLSLSALITRLRWWPTAACMVRVQPTSTASVVQSHLSRAVRCWGQPTTENSLSPEREESATVHAASVLLHHLSGTIYPDISETMTLVVNNSLVIWREFCLHGPVRQRRLWERLFKRRFMNGLTYLLTYLLTYMHCICIACMVHCNEISICFDGTPASLQYMQYIVTRNCTAPPHIITVWYVVCKL